MRLLVCGGRKFGFFWEKDLSDDDVIARYNEYQFVWTTLDREAPDALVVIEGEATGTDTAAKNWALARGKTVEKYPAAWNRYRKSAGIVRNRLILQRGKPTRVVAFPGLQGTRSMIKLAREAGVPVLEIAYDRRGTPAGEAPGREPTPRLDV